MSYKPESTVAERLLDQKALQELMAWRAKAQVEAARVEGPVAVAASMASMELAPVTLNA